MKPATPAWIAAAFLLLSPCVHADGRPPFDAPPACPPPHGAAGMPLLPPPLLDRLKLDAAQEDKLFALQHAMAPRQRTAAKAAAAARDALRQLVDSGRYDAAQAKQLAAAQGQAVADLALLQAEADAQLRALLTPEQRARLAAGPGQHDRPARPAEARH